MFAVREVPDMRTFLRIVVATLLAWTVGSLPACGTMGSGHMYNLIEAPTTTST